MYMIHVLLNTQEDPYVAVSSVVLCPANSSCLYLHPVSNNINSGSLWALPVFLSVTLPGNFEGSKLGKSPLGLSHFVSHLSSIILFNSQLATVLKTTVSFISYNILVVSDERINLAPILSS